MPLTLSYRPIASAAKTVIGPQLYNVVDTTGVGTYACVEGTGSVAAATNGSTFGARYIDPASYSIPGTQTRFILRASLYVNGVAPARSFQFALRPITAVAGAADVLTSTFGAVVTDSNFTFTTPAANSRNQQSSAQFSLTADYYTIAFDFSGGNITADSVIHGAVCLDVVNV